MASFRALVSRVMDPINESKETQKVITSVRPKLMSYSSPQPLPLAQKLTENPVTHKNMQSTVACVYQTPVGGYWRIVTVLWCKNLMNHHVTISVDSLENDYHYSCKIDLKPWHFWSKKGLKSFHVDGTHIEIYWDFRSVKFSSGPEPCSNYYIAMVSEEEVVLLLGDYKKKAFKRTKSRPALVEAMMFYKREHVFNKKCFSTLVKFDPKKKEHEIIVESSTLGPRDPEMWISVDGIVLIHVQNLQWKFRGNETVLVNKIPIKVFWDVHAWLFNTPGSDHGLFIFKPGPPEAESDVDESRSSGEGDNSYCSSGDSEYYSTQSYSKASQFCLFLYAWKLE